MGFEMFLWELLVDGNGGWSSCGKTNTKFKTFFHIITHFSSFCSRLSCAPVQVRDRRRVPFRPGNTGLTRPEAFPLPSRVVWTASVDVLHSFFFDGSVKSQNNIQCMNMYKISIFNISTHLPNTAKRGHQSRTERLTVRCVAFPSRGLCRVREVQYSTFTTG